MPANSLYFVRISFYLQGLGDTVSPMLSGIAEFVMRTGCVLLLPLWLGAEGIFYAEVLAWTGADLVLIPSCIWALKRISNFYIEK